MATRVRMSTDTSLLNKNELYRSLQEIRAKDIAIWEIHYTGVSSNSETEVDAPTTAFDGSRPIVADITCKTRVNSIGSEYITWVADDGDGTTTTHYFYWDKAEITQVTCLEKTECVAESTFHFFVDDGAGSEVEYYVWLNVSGTDSDPVESGTAIEADISGATTATEVAEVIDGLIDAKANVGCANTDAILTITNANNGNVTDCHDGETTATGFTIAIEQGGDDPSATGSGHAVDISSDTTAANVADALATVMDGVANLTAAASDAVITAENDNHSVAVADPSDSGSAVSSISVTADDSVPYAGAKLYIVSSSANDADAAAKHARKVKIIGIDENNDPIIEEVSLDGASYVETSNAFKAVSHMYVSSFGTGGSDAAGNITLENTDTGNGSTLLTISANGTESNGARIYVPDGSFAVIEKAKLVQLTNANTGTVTVNIYYSGFDHAKNTDSDLDYLQMIAFNQVPMEISDSDIKRVGTDTAYIVVKERERGTDGNETFDFILKIITWN
jgi:hypothetical protein